MKKSKFFSLIIALSTVSGALVPCLTSCGEPKAEGSVYGGSKHLNTFYGDGGQDTLTWKFKYRGVVTKPGSWGIDFKEGSKTSENIKIDDGRVYWVCKKDSVLETGTYTFRVAAAMGGTQNYFSDYITLTVNEISEDVVSGGSEQLTINCNEAGSDKFYWIAKKADGSIVTDAELSLEKEEFSPPLNGLKINNDGKVSWLDNVSPGEYSFRVKATKDTWIVYSKVITYTFNQTASVLTIYNGSTGLTTDLGNDGADDKQWKVKLDEDEIQNPNLELVPVSPNPLPKNIFLENGYLKWKYEFQESYLGVGTYTFKVQATYKTKIATSEVVTLTVKNVEGFVVTGGSELLSGPQNKPGQDEFVWKAKNGAIEVPATLSLEPVEETKSIAGITIQNGKVQWIENMIAGTYKFHVKAIIDGQEPVYSKTITLTITEVKFVLNQARNEYLYATNLGGQDDMQWTATLGEDVVKPEFTLLPSGSTTTIPSGLTIDNGYIKWTDELAYGTTIYFKIKATYAEGTYETTSDEIKFQLVEPTDQSNFTWDVDTDKKIAILKSGANASGNVVIPTYYKHTDNENYLVTTLANSCFMNNANLTNITIPDNVKCFENDPKTGSRTFYVCTELLTIHLPYRLESCGSEAFGSCPKVKSLTIPNTWKTIYNSFCYHCESLEQINLPNSIETLGYSAFSSTLLRQITIPPLVKTIPGGCFSGCDGFTSFTIPNTVTKLEKGAFFACGSLANFYYEGTRAEYEANVTREIGWHEGCNHHNTVWLHFSDGETIDISITDPDPEP